MVKSSGVVAVALQGSLYSKGDKVLEPKKIGWWIFLGGGGVEIGQVFVEKSYAKKNTPREI